MLGSAEIEVRLYSTRDGKVPFTAWLESEDWDIQQRIESRIGRIRLGNLGDHKSLGGGLFELRIDAGPGYRIYFTRKGQRVVVLLAGGEKHGQDPDIRRARAYLDDLLERTP